MSKINSKTVLGLGLAAASILMLTGCGSTFRNRAFDYTRTEVNQVPPLSIPAGVNKPEFQPALTVPPGPNSYQPTTMPVMTPPNYNDTYSVNKKTKQVTPLTSASAVPTAAKPSKLPVASSHTKHFKSRTVAHVASPSVNLSSQVVISTGNVPMLLINAPFDMSWQKMHAAIEKSGFRVVNSDQTKGYYFITLASDNNTADAVLLYLKQNQNVTQVILYNSAGNPDSSANADLTLKQLSKNL